MSPSRRRPKARLLIALLTAPTFAGACTGWHTTTLQPQRFSAGRSPEQVRLTFRDGTMTTVHHPVVLGDSLIWAESWSDAHGDSARSAVLTSTVQQVEVHGVDAPRTIGLLVVLGGVVGGIAALVHSIANSFGNVGN